MNALEHPTQLWDQITAGFRQACYHRRQGRQAEAASLLERQLPQTIADWSQASPSDPARKKALLLEMFAREQQRVEEAIALQALLARHCAEELIPSLRAELTAEVRRLIEQDVTARAGHSDARMDPKTDSQYAPSLGSRPNRIPFDDLPAVIDAVLADQRGAGSFQARPHPPCGAHLDGAGTRREGRQAKSCPW